MNSITWSVLCTFVFAGISPCMEKPPFDKQEITEYLRYADGLGNDVSVEVQEPTPSLHPGFYEFHVRMDDGRSKAVKTYYMTEDGTRIAAAPVFNLHMSPFANSLLLLKEDHSPILGPKDAPISIYVFSDFECPYCRQEAATLRTGIEEKYAGQVRVVFKDFPLEAMHPWARIAAVQGVCINRVDQAAFWTYHDWIFQHQAELTASNLAGKLQEFEIAHSLDGARLAACLNDPSAMAEVDKTIADGRNLGVVQTPTLFVNGRMLNGAMPAATLNQVIEFELAHQRIKESPGYKYSR